jgi:hypothetical protein
VRRLALLLVPVVLMACGSSDHPIAATTLPPSSSGPERPDSSDEEQAVADLAARQGVDPSTISTVSFEEVTWRDGSIGCPQPDMNYTQALVPGIRLVLELNGRRYEYHAGGERTIFLCEKPEPPVGE